MGRAAPAQGRTRRLLITRILFVSIIGSLPPSIFRSPSLRRPPTIPDKDLEPVPSQPKAAGFPNGMFGISQGASRATSCEVKESCVEPDQGAKTPGGKTTFGLAPRHSAQHTPPPFEVSCCSKSFNPVGSIFSRVCRAWLVAPSLAVGPFDPSRGRVAGENTPDCAFFSDSFLRSPTSVGLVKDGGKLRCDFAHPTANGSGVAGARARGGPTTDGSNELGKLFKKKKYTQRTQEGPRTHAGFVLLAGRGGKRRKNRSFDLSAVLPSGKRIGAGGFIQPAGRGRQNSCAGAIGLEGAGWGGMSQVSCSPPEYSQGADVGPQKWRKKKGKVNRRRQTNSADSGG